MRFAFPKNPSLPKPFPRQDQLQIYSAADMQCAGLETLGFDAAWRKRNFEESKENRLRNAFGCTSAVLALLWEEIQTVIKNPINPKKETLHQFFVAMHFLKHYDTEEDQYDKWKIASNTFRDQNWNMIQKVSELFHLKCGWPEDNFDDDILVGSIDGTHIMTEEVTHESIPKDPAMFSWKHHSAGWNLEIALALRSSQIIHMSDPKPAGKWNDIKIFKQCGLLSQLKKKKKKMIADSGYQGCPKYLCLQNSYDSKEVAEFKRRARCRHEFINKKFKNFKILNSATGFRSSHKKLKMVIRAVAVIVQTNMDCGEPLWDV